MNQIFLTSILALFLVACASQPHPFDYDPAGLTNKPIPDYEKDEEGFLEYYLELFQ
jgi:hypothetical protein